MATKDVNTSDIEKQKELDDMTTCCICTEVYTDPKMLPCIHTFCLKCLKENGLKTNKGPGDEMPCPLCRQMVKIPAEGFDGLKKNFFIDRLIKANVTYQSAPSTSSCNACAEANKRDADVEIPTADTYCTDCQQTLCEECCRQHKQIKSTEGHKLVAITEHEGGQNVIINQDSGACEFHEQKVLEFYCADCKTVVCGICLFEKHSGPTHNVSHVSKFADSFRKHMKSDSQAIKECGTKAEIKKAKLFRVKKDTEDKAKNLECNIANRKDELKQFTDKHATSLIQSLRSIRQSKLKELKTSTGDIEEYLSNLERFNVYCQRIMAKGSAIDICREFSDLSGRAIELQQQCQVLIDREDRPFNANFRKLELGDFLGENLDNLIGEIEGRRSPLC